MQLIRCCPTCFKHNIPEPVLSCPISFLLRGLVSDAAQTVILWIFVVPEKFFGWKFKDTGNKIQPLLYPLSKVIPKWVYEWGNGLTHQERKRGTGIIAVKPRMKSER